MGKMICTKEAREKCRYAFICEENAIVSDNSICVNFITQLEKAKLYDIQQQREFGKRSNWDSLGDPCDVRTWERFETWLKEQREKIHAGP